MFREVSVIEVRELLRVWMLGAGLRRVGALAGVDRKTARRYTDAAVEAGLDRDGDTDQLTDELIGAVVEAVRPERPFGHGTAWESLSDNHDQIQKWVTEGLTVVKIGDLLARDGVVAPQRTLRSSQPSTPVTRQKLGKNRNRPERESANLLVGGSSPAAPLPSQSCSPAQPCVSASRRRPNSRPGRPVRAGLQRRCVLPAQL
jgi:hypothetical protein